MSGHSVPELIDIGVELEKKRQLGDGRRLFAKLPLQLGLQRKSSFAAAIGASKEVLIIEL